MLDGPCRVLHALRRAGFMHYNLGYFGLEQKTLQTLDNPFGTRLSPMSWDGSHATATATTAAAASI